MDHILRHPLVPPYRLRHANRVHTFRSAMRPSWCQALLNDSSSLAEKQSAKWFKKTAVTRLRNNFENHHHVWGRFVQPPAYAYNTKVHSLANNTPYSFGLARQPPRPLTLYASSPIPIDAPSETSMRDLQQRLEARVQTLRTITNVYLEKNAKATQTELQT